MKDDKQKPKSRAEKMYSNSPRMERNTETGKMGVTQGQKAAAQQDSGTAGMAEHESHVKDMLHKHALERMDMHHKHEKEHMDLMHSMKSRAAADGAESGEEKIADVQEQGDKE